MFLNPVINGYITYADLKNGSICLYDIFILNELQNYKTDYDDLIRKEYYRRSKK
jgi:hypothetical protein